MIETEFFGYTILVCEHCDEKMVDREEMKLHEAECET